MPAPPRRRRPLRLAGLILLAVVLGAVLIVVTPNALRQIRSQLSSSSPQAIDPSLFSRGACMAYPPTNGDNGETVFLDAGHGGVDPGGIGQTESGSTVTEAKVNLPIELDTMAILRNEGYRVVVSRTADTTVLKLKPDDLSQGALSILGSHDDVAARDICANMAGADVLVGIYMDASSSASNGGSLTTYDPDRPFSAKSERLADLVQHDVLNAMNSRGWQIPDDGVTTDGGLGSSVSQPGSSLAAKAANYNHLMELGPAETGYFTTPSQMPGTVIEPLYLTDPFEGSIAATPADQQVIATGLAQAVQQYFGR